MNCVYKDIRELAELEVPKIALKTFSITPTPIDPFKISNILPIFLLALSGIHFVWSVLFVYPLGHFVQVSKDVELPPIQIKSFSIVKQSDEHPSPPSMLPSSQTSASTLNPSPQIETHSTGLMGSFG